MGTTWSSSKSLGVLLVAFAALYTASAHCQRYISHESIYMNPKELSIESESSLAGGTIKIRDKRSGEILYLGGNPISNFLSKLSTDKPKVRLDPKELSGTSARKLAQKLQERMNKAINQNRWVKVDFFFWDSSFGYDITQVPLSVSAISKYLDVKEKQVELTKAINASPGLAEIFTRELSQRDRDILKMDPATDADVDTLRISLTSAIELLEKAEAIRHEAKIYKDKLSARQPENKKAIALAEQVICYNRDSLKALKSDIDILATIIKEQDQHIKHACRDLDPGQSTVVDEEKAGGIRATYRMTRSEKDATLFFIDLNLAFHALPGSPNPAQDITDMAAKVDQCIESMNRKLIWDKLKLKIRRIDTKDISKEMEKIRRHIWVSRDPLRERIDAMSTQSDCKDIAHEIGH